MRNNSSLTDSKSIILRVNNKNEAQEIVTLDPGKSQIISFPVKRNSTGTYKVSVEGLSGSFEVTGASAKAGGQPVDMSLIIVASLFSAGLLLIVVLIILLVRRSSRESYSVPVDVIGKRTNSKSSKRDRWD